MSNCAYCDEIVIFSRVTGSVGKSRQLINITQDPTTLDFCSKEHKLLWIYSKQNKNDILYPFNNTLNIS